MIFVNAHLHWNEEKQQVIHSDSWNFGYAVTVHSVVLTVGFQNDWTEHFLIYGIVEIESLVTVGYGISETVGFVNVLQQGIPETEGYEISGKQGFVIDVTEGFVSAVIVGSGIVVTEG